MGAGRAHQEDGFPAFGPIAGRVLHHAPAHARAGKGRRRRARMAAVGAAGEEHGGKGEPFQKHHGDDSRRERPAKEGSRSPAGGSHPLGGFHDQEGPGQTGHFSMVAARREERACRLACQRRATKKPANSGPPERANYFPTSPNQPRRRPASPRRSWCGRRRPCAGRPGAGAPSRRSSRPRASHRCSPCAG